jgi:anti-sigma B factor antagonist
VDGLLADGERRLVLDLGSLPFMNSSALGYLIKTRSLLLERGRQLGLARLQQAIRNILVVTNLESLFALYDSAEAAVAGLTQHAAAQGHPVPPAGPNVKRREVKRAK